MKVKCPKCGKVSEISAQELRRQEGNVVCPRCLTVFKEPLPATGDGAVDTPPPLPKARRAAQASAAQPKPRKQPISFVPPPLPPPLPSASRPAAASRSTSQPRASQPPQRPQYARPAAPRPQPWRAQQPQRPRQPLAPKAWGKMPQLHSMSYWGCLGYAALITVILLLIYFLMGNVFA